MRVLSTTVPGPDNVRITGQTEELLCLISKKIVPSTAVLSPDNVRVNGQTEELLRLISKKKVTNNTVQKSNT